MDAKKIETRYRKREERRLKDLAINAERERKCDAKAEERFRGVSNEALREEAKRAEDRRDLMVRLGCPVAFALVVFALVVSKILNNLLCSVIVGVAVALIFYSTVPTVLILLSYPIPTAKYELERRFRDSMKGGEDIEDCLH